MLKLVDSGDELYNVASSTAYQQIHIAYGLFLLKYVFLNFDILLRPRTIKWCWRTRSLLTTI
jgi:hypothetical protein